MFANLRAEMARNGLKTQDLAMMINVSLKTIRNKLEKKTGFKLSEALLINQQIAPELKTSFLFEWRAS